MMVRYAGIGNSPATRKVLWNDLNQTRVGELENLDLILSFGGKAVATGLVLLVASLVAERAGVLIAALVITLPLNAGPGFFFVALEAEPGFLAKGALVSFTATAAVHTFMTAYAHASSRLTRFWMNLGVATAAWVVVALPLTNAQPSLLWSVVIVAAGFALAHILRYRGYDQKDGGDRAKRQGGFGFLVFRAVIGGSVVALAATFSKVLGPSLTGLAFAFPIMTSANAWMFYHSYGAKFSAATISNARKGLISYVSFCFALAILPGYVDNLTAWALALVVSIIVTGLILLAGRLGIPQRLAKFGF